MPYINIKAYPKDEATKQKVAERINQIFLEEWGCPQSAISISIEAVEPQNWTEQVVEKDIMQNLDNMLIVDGEKTYW